jgi:hypothetical protein
MPRGNQTKHEIVAFRALPSLILRYRSLLLQQATLQRYATVQ